MTELITRSFEVREDAEETGVIEGRAVPFNVETQVGDFTEVIREGAVIARDNIKLFFGHKDIIGRVIGSENREDGFYIRAKISDTTLGRDVLTMLRDGALDKFSIGFQPVDDSFDDGVVTRTKIDVREVSVVPIPAYESASILSVREAEETVREDIPTDKEGVMTDVTTADAVNELRENYEELERTIALLKNEDKPAKGQSFFRSAADLIKGIVSGDERALEEYRAYTGGTTADTLVTDTLKNAWVGELDDYVAKSTVLSGLFATGTLPEKGNFIEAGHWTLSSLNGAAASGVRDQGAEGDTLVKMPNLVYATDTYAVKTVGGRFELSRQEIERSPQNVLRDHLEMQGVALGEHLENLVRTAFNTARSANSASTITVADGSSWADWQGAIIDAAVFYKQHRAGDFVLVVDKDRFKALAKMTDLETGKPVLDQDQGRVNVRTLTGQVFSVPVVLDLLENNTGRATFVAPESIRVYSKPVTRLADEDVTTLTKTFSLYQYVAVAAERSYGIVPVTVTAEGSE